MNQNKARSAEELFIDKYGENDFLKRIVEEIFVQTDYKNKRNPYLENTIDDQIERLEKKYGVQGFNEALDKTTARAFMRACIEKQAETDISYDPHKYFIHMLTGKLTEPGFVGALTGMLMHGNQVTNEVSSFAAVLEKRVGDITKEMLGYKPGTHAFAQAASFITSGGTEANHLALLVGRNSSYAKQEGINMQKEGFDGIIKSGKYRTPKMIVPASAHYSFKKIANAIGIGENNIIYIQSNMQGQMDTALLQKTLDEFDTEKNKLVSVVGVFGSTETGAVDDLESILESVETFEEKTGEKVWKHIDAAYGGPAIVTEKYENMQEFFAKYDSVTFDPHKQLWVPYGAGSVTFKNILDLRSVSTDAPYIGNDGVNGKTDKDFIEEFYTHLGAIKLIGSQSTQGPISTYLTLKCFGKDGIKNVIERTFEVAQYLAKKLSQQQLPNGRIEVFNPNPDMNLVNWRFIPTKYDCLTKEKYHQTIVQSGKELPQNMQDLNSINQGIFKHFTTDKTEFMVSRSVMETFNMNVQRAVIMNPYTNENDIDKFVRAYVNYIETL